IPRPEVGPAECQNLTDFHDLRLTGQRMSCSVLGNSTRVARRLLPPSRTGAHRAAALYYGRRRRRQSQFPRIGFGSDYSLRLNVRLDGSDNRDDGFGTLHAVGTGLNRATHKGAGERIRRNLPQAEALVA